MAEGKMTSERDIDYALELRALAHDVSKWDAEICEAAAQEIERLRAALDDMMDLAEMLAGNEGFETYQARFTAARKALKGETNEGNTK